MADSNSMAELSNEVFKGAIALHGAAYLAGCCSDANAAGDMVAVFAYIADKLRDDAERLDTLVHRVEWERSPVNPANQQPVEADHADA